MTEPRPESSDTRQVPQPGTIGAGEVLLDAELRITAWNRWMERRTGILAGEVLGVRLVDRFPEIATRDKQPILLDVLRSGRPAFLSALLHEYLFFVPWTRGGLSTAMAQNVSIFPRLDPDGAEGVAVIVEDCTEQLLHEKELARLNAMLAGLAAIARQVVGADSEQELITRCCDIFVNIMACEWAEIVLRPYEGQPAPHSSCGARPNDASRIRTVPLASRGESLGILAFSTGSASSHRHAEDHCSGAAHDIALGIAMLRERRQRERAVVEATRLAHEARAARAAAESADRVKSAFLASMSHELRTPLNSIIGFTGLLLQGDPGPLNAEQNKQLGMVRSSAHHLLNLINDILDISRIEAGQFELSSEPFDVAQTVETSANMFSPAAAAKGIDLEIHVAPGIPLIVGDRRRFGQVLINLLGNAVKFTERGSVRLDCSAADGWLNVRVSDTGVGIKAEQIGSLFRPFEQLDTGAARRHEGTGLGLAISKKLVSFMGGEITAESEPGIGSVFEFSMPVRPPSD